MRDLVPFIQFKIREKHPWRIVTLPALPATLLKLRLLHGCFSRLLNCRNGNKRAADHMWNEALAALPTLSEICCKVKLLDSLWLRGLFRALSNIWWSFFAKIVNSFKPLVIFAKRFHRRCLTGSLIGSYLVLFVHWVKHNTSKRKKKIVS